MQQLLKLNPWRIIGAILLYIILSEILKDVLIFAHIEPWLQTEMSAEQAESFSELAEYVLLAGLLIPLFVFGVYLPVKRNNEQLKQIAQEAHLANHNKTRYYRQLAHEIRNPLNVISTLSELLNEQQNAEISPQNREILHDIYVSSNHLNQLVCNILDIALIETGELKKNTKEVNLHELFLDVVHSQQVLAQDFASQIRLDIAELPKKAITNPTHIRQILVNLIGNAVHYCKQCSITVHATLRDGKLVLRVKDDGPGIPHDKLDLIFDEFERGDQTSGVGVGLGLAIVKHLCELHDGHVSVTSEKGKGTCFTVEIPYVPVEETAAV